MTLLLLVACTGSAKPVPTVTPTSGTGALRTSIPHRGGEAVFGAEFWPECLNPITSCASADWSHYVVFQHVLPRAMQLDPRGNFIASPLLVEAPTLANGELRPGPPFTVTFRISPHAVWDDGSPITSGDFEFTWRAILGTSGYAYRADEYRHVVSVDARDPHAAVVRFDQVYVDWPDLFGGAFDYVLKASAFPSADPKAPDLAKEMMSEIPFSGGPFRLQYWDENKAVLVRNDRYFGPQALLDRVTFIPFFYRGGLPNALTEGTISATASSWGIRNRPAGSLEAPDVEVLTGDWFYLEALWFNHSRPPLDDPRVREALMYAIDRQAVIDRIVRRWNPHAQVLNCGLVAIPGGPWCRTHPFERFTYDPAKARSILETDGYDCSRTYCVRHGKTLKIEYAIIGNDLLRAATAQLLIRKARAGGFRVEPHHYGTFLLDIRRLALVDSAVEADPTPRLSEMFACDQIPSKKNGFQGDNRNHWCNPQADRLMKEADRELDPQRRAALFDHIHELEAHDFLSLPLYVVPAVSAWRSDMIAGPIGLWNSSPYGLFFNIDQWYRP